MKILHANGFNEEELYRQRAVVYTNIIISMGILIKAMKEFDITFKNIEREVYPLFLISKNPYFRKTHV